MCKILPRSVHDPQRVLERTRESVRLEKVPVLRTKELKTRERRLSCGSQRTRKPLERFAASGSPLQARRTGGKATARCNDTEVLMNRAEGTTTFLAIYSN